MIDIKDKKIDNFNLLEIEYNVYISHNGIKSAFPKVEYYSYYNFKPYPLILFEVNNNYEITDKCIKNWDYYIIDGNICTSYSSNGFDYFEKLRGIEHIKLDEQMNIFDFIKVS